MDIHLTINEKQRLAYIPKALYEVLGSKVKATPNRAAVLLTAENTSVADAIKSLDIIKTDLLHLQEIQQKKEECKVRSMQWLNQVKKLKMNCEKN